MEKVSMIHDREHVMPDYLTMLQQSDNSGTTTVTGVVARRPASGLWGPKGCFPILICLCVHDRSDNPCPCDGPIIWIPDRSVKSKKEHRQGTKESNSTDLMMEIAVDSKARVFIDETRPSNDHDLREGMVLMQVGKDEFKRTEGKAWIQQYVPIRAEILLRTLKCVYSDHRLADVARKKKGGFWGAVSAVLGAAGPAFDLGVEIGTAIDEETGISSDIADWLYDTLGPFDELF